MKKQNIFIFLLIVLLLIPQNPYVYGGKDDIIYFFETDRCLSCIEVKEELSKYPDIKLKTYNIGKEEDRDFLYQLAEEHNIEIGKLLQTPIIVYNDEFYIGQNDAMNNLIPLIQNKDSSDENSKVSFFLSLLTGLLNGFNPCSIAMYLYVVTLVTSNYDNKGKMLRYILLYILSIYLSYILVGLLLSKGYMQIESFGKTGQILQILMGALFLILAVYYFKDYLILKLNKKEQLKTQLGGRARLIMENKLKQSIASGSILSPILGGILVAILGFSCTGQIYIATLFYALSKETVSANMILYLLFYNMMIVLPLLVFTFLIYKGKKMFKISLAMSKRLKEIKLITSIFFALVSIYIFVNLLF